jgi:hypothetical protein
VLKGGITNMQVTGNEVLLHGVAGPAPATNTLHGVVNEAFTICKRLCFNTEVIPYMQAGNMFIVVGCLYFFGGFYGEI